MRTRLSAFVFASFLLAACSWNAAPPDGGARGLGTRVIGDCHNAAAAARAAARSDESWVRADLDGDGAPDAAGIAKDPRGGSGCTAFFVAELTGGRTYVRPLSFPGIQNAPGLPAVVGAARINQRPGAEVIVAAAAGASTEFVVIFTLARRGPVAMEISSGPDAGALIPYGGSVAHLDGAACARRRGIVVLSHAEAPGAAYRLVRRYYRARSVTLAPAGARRSGDVEARDLRRFPEFRGPPFWNCTRA